MQKLELFDQLLDGISVQEKRKKDKCLAWHFPDEVHAMFRDLQEDSKRDFGKGVEHIIEQLIRYAHAKRIEQKAS